MYTIEDVEKIWKRFDEIKEQAEQHDFPALAILDFKFTPLYEDLHEHWDENHARTFMAAMVMGLCAFDPTVGYFIKDCDEHYEFFYKNVIEPYERRIKNGSAHAYSDESSATD